MGSYTSTYVGLVQKIVFNCKIWLNLMLNVSKYFRSDRCSGKSVVSSLKIHYEYFLTLKNDFLLNAYSV